MNIGIDHLYNFGNFSQEITGSPDDGFAAALGGFLSGNIIISPRLENRLAGNSETAQEIREKITQAMKELGSKSEDSVIIVNKQGEVSQYSFKKENDKTRLTAEEVKAAAKARARKKARLDAYFHLLERVSIKRKLIEQENARAVKKYRCSVTRLDIIARNRQITSPPLNPDYYY